MEAFFFTGTARAALYWLWNWQLNSNTWNAEAGPRDGARIQLPLRPYAPPENVFLSVLSSAPTTHLHSGAAWRDAAQPKGNSHDSLQPGL